MRKLVAFLAVLAVFGLATAAQADFTPTDVTSVKVWFDPSDTSKLSLTGSLVDSWTDSTTSPITASASGTERPTYNATAFGTGLPGLDFDGSNDALSSTVGGANEAKFTTAANFFAVVKRAADESTAGGDTVIAYGSSGGGGNTNYIWQVDRGGTPGPTSYPNVYAGGGWRDGNANVGTAAHILELSFSTSGGYAFYIDGVAAGTDSNTTAWSNSPNPNQFFIGIQQSVNGWNGLLGDIVLSNAVLSPDDRNKMGEYLETLYGLNTAYEYDFGPAIPEPCSLGLLGVAVLALRRRRA